MVFGRLLLVLLLSAFANGCARRDRLPVAGGAILTNPNDVVGAPPTNAPTLAPKTPGPAAGWIVPPDDGQPQMLYQRMSRTNCLKTQITVPDGNGGMVEEWNYVCDFTVCVQVELSGDGGLCGCGIYAGNPAGSTYDEGLYSTTVEDFQLVVLDTTNQQTLVEIETWDLNPTDPTPEMMSVIEEGDAIPGLMELTNAINGDMDYSDALGIFTGDIKANSLPDEAKAILFDPERPEETAHFQNNKVAMCFGVTQTYKTLSKWQSPREPKMGLSPAAWSTDCMPIQMPVPQDGGEGEGEGSGKKRQNADQKYWAIEYLLFAPHTNDGGNAGQVQYDRHITAYYLNSNCETGAFSIDVRFTSVVEDQRNHPNYHVDRYISGAFVWHRTINSVYVVGSTPVDLEVERSVPNAFRRVIWNDNDKRSRDDYGVYVDNKLAVLLSGDCTLLGEKVEVDGLGEGLFYKEWPTCEENVVEDSPPLCRPIPEGALPKGKIVLEFLEENVYFYQLSKFGSFDANADEAPDPNEALMCSGYENFCKTQSVILTFQNFGGGNARDFSKQARSWMVTGPRDYISMCSEDLYGGLSAEVFTLSNSPFKPWGHSAVMKKRGIRQDDETMGLVQNGNGYVPLGAGTNSPYDTPVGKGGVTDAGVGFQVMAGSMNGGDHPLTLFPEAYAAPVSLDPFDQAADIARIANPWNGTPPPCQFGTLGCGCRAEATRGARPACDSPLSCSFSGYCELPACPAGELGCACGSGCGEGAICDEDHDTCVFKITCDVGEPGCDAELKDGMDGTEPSHYICRSLSSPIETSGGFVCGFEKCMEEFPGCTCDENNQGGPNTCSGRASGGSENRSGTCEPGGMCLGEIPPGKYGGVCKSGDDEPCEGDFVCKSGVCTIPECVPGSAGCLCRAGSECDEGSCDISGRCLIERCEPGTKGCECTFGICQGGYECVTSQSLGSNRCVEKSCPIGSPGCPCNDDGTCEKDKFECKAMRRNGDDERCVNSGIDCSEDLTDLCTAFCGEGLVKYCPPCTGETPQCIDSSSTVTYMSMTVAIAAIAFALF